MPRTPGCRFTFPTSAGGFDPTNGTITHLDHIRVAYGRHFRDTAPTAGTIFGEALNEQMAVDVEVREVLPLGVPPEAGAGAHRSA